MKKVPLNVEYSQLQSITFSLAATIGKPIKDWRIKLMNKNSGIILLK